MSKASAPRCLSILALTGAALICVPLASAQSTKPKTDQMDQMDVNKDKQISKEEYMKAQEKKFDAMDKDRNKMLSKDEWVQHQLEEGSGGGG